MIEYTMFVSSNKKRKSLDAQIVPGVPVVIDITHAKYTRRLVSQETGTVIYVLGTGDVLATVTLVQLAKAFVTGNFEYKRGKWHYATNPR